MTSILLRHKPTSAEWPLVVVRRLHRTLRESDFLPGELFVRDEAQQLSDAIEARPLLVIRTKDVPRRLLRVGRLEHHVAGAGILEPPAPRGQVHRAELPLPQRVGDTGFEPTLLLRVAHLQPELD